jgi:hypothetical protein
MGRRDRRLWQGVVTGDRIVASLSTSRGPTIAGLVGESLGALATAPVKPWQHWSLEQQWARTERAATHVVRRIPEVDDQLRNVLARLHTLHDSFADRGPLPAHGAASSDQWLDDGSTLGLVDFDRFCWSDPELDAATFLGSLDFDPGLRDSLDELEDAVLDGFRRAGFNPDSRRWSTYRIGTRLRKVARTAMAVRPDGDERAMRHIGGVLNALRAVERQLSR